ncbi:MAG TPA: DUF418 domain-containing protein [Steroidobacteraceae bacterium]|nr:DUF418 domain-containing protein [Steroidobacteraceae bacterium]
MNETATPVRPADRVESIDVVRGVALFGVMAINLLTSFRASIFQQFLPPVTASGAADRWTEAIAYYGLDMKAFSLFSFLFGVGLAIQYERLSRHGSPLYWLSRRLAILLVFGLIHLFFIWNGDILTEYAVAGFVVLPLLVARGWLLAAATAGCLVFYTLMPVLRLPIPWPDQSGFQQLVAAANHAYGHGSFMQEHRFAMREVAAIVPLHLSVLPRTIGLFALGVLSWRAGLFARPYENCARIAVLAVILTALGGVLTHADGPMTGRIAPALLALGYCATLVWLVEFTSLRGLLSAFAPLGRMAFSNYIAESLIFSVVFFGFGLGLYGRIGPASTLLLGSSVYAVQMAVSAWWLRRYRFGPLEWLWRSLMYGRRQPFRRSAA